MVKVMFLCTGNSCRSQMAEGFARERGKGLIDAYSAGISPAGVNPNAVRAMTEIGIDISGQSSEPIDLELLDRMDMVVTLCGHANEMCPVTPTHIKRLHWPIDDPVGTTGTDEEVMAAFRKARDEIGIRVKSLVESLRG